MLCTMLSFYWKSLEAERKIEDAEQPEKQGDLVWSANWTRCSFTHHSHLSWDVRFIDDEKMAEWSTIHYYSARGIEFSS